MEAITRGCCSEEVGHFRARLAGIFKLGLEKTFRNNLVHKREIMSSTSEQFDATMPRVAPEKPDLTLLLFSFQGRVPRSTFWCYSLTAAFSYLAIVTVLSFAAGFESAVAGIASLLLYIPLVWISLALQVKRWHDRDKSGWWVLIGLVPLIGAIWTFIEVGCLPGTSGPNSHGPNPLGDSA